MNPTEEHESATRLNELLDNAGLEPLSPAQMHKFATYLTLILRWNAKTNLTAIRDPEAILSRHFVECIASARALPAGITTLLDLGSGAGFPGIPVAICRPEIAATLAESQGKKAAFLQEAVRILRLNAKVYAGRAEKLTSSFDCVILRAVDKMAEMVGVAAPLVAPGGWLALMTTREDVGQLQEAAGALSWRTAMPLPGGLTRILALGHLK